MKLSFSQFISALLGVGRKKLGYLILLLVVTTLLNAQIVIYGDTRTHPDTHQKIVAEIVKHHPSIVSHTGDLNSRGLLQSEYDTFKEIISPLTQTAAFYPARGNHEKNLKVFLHNFPQLQGSSYYTVDYDGIRFIVLDSVQDLKPESAQYKWLAGLLDKRVPSILILHHPIFSSGEHGDKLGLQLYLPRLLDRKEVLAVFSGHDHDYERSIYKGVNYVVTGGGGAPLRNAKSHNIFSVKFVETNHFIYAQRAGQVLKFTVYDLQGEILDSFEVSGFTKP